MNSSFSWGALWLQDRFAMANQWLRSCMHAANQTNRNYGRLIINTAPQRRFRRAQLDINVISHPLSCQRNLWSYCLDQPTHNPHAEHYGKQSSLGQVMKLKCESRLKYWLFSPPSKLRLNSWNKPSELSIAFAGRIVVKKLWLRS